MSTKRITELDIESNVMDDAFLIITQTPSGGDSVVRRASIYSILRETHNDISDLAAYIGYTAPDIYGVEVDFENNRFTRLAGAAGLVPGADFDNITPWNRRRCNVTHDGYVTAYYGDENYTETGFTAAEIIANGMNTYPVGTPVNVMVEQPPFYYKFVPLKLEKKGDSYALRKARYYICNTPKEGFSLHPAFQNTEKPIYLAAYESCLLDSKGNIYETPLNILREAIDVTAYRLTSVSGGNVITSARAFTGFEETSGNSAVEALKNMIYEQYQIQSENVLSATQLLFLVEYASFDSQTAIGAGAGGVSETGGTASLGNTTGTGANNSVSYRGEENLWGNIWHSTLSTVEMPPESGFISAFKFKPDSRNTNALLSITQRAAGTNLIFNVAETSGNSVNPVSDMCLRDSIISADVYVLHGGNSSDSESGLFALYHTPNNTDTPFTVRVFYSAENAMSMIRDTDETIEMM